MQDLVLIGGVYAHAIALRLFGITPLPGVRLTLISENCAAYSGKLSGHVAGIYSHGDCHIGSTPHLPAGLVGMNRVISAKPVHHFLEQWRSLLHTVFQ